MTADIVTFPQRPETNEDFGGCPECGGCSEIRNVGRDHVGCCDVHQTAWWIGSNLFSSWCGEPEETWDANRRLLRPYRVVDPIYPKPPNEEKRQREKLNRLLDDARRLDKGYGVEFGPSGIRALGPDECPFRFDDEVPQ